MRPQTKGSHTELKYLTEGLLSCNLKIRKGKIIVEMSVVLGAAGTPVYINIDNLPLKFADNIV